MIRIQLPYPPSVNSYWRHLGRGKHLISAEGRNYKRRVAELVLVERACRSIQRDPMRGRLVMEVVAYPPDSRRRDIDNLLKATLDALGDAGVYVDDSQIRELLIKWGDKRAGGALDVAISEIA